MIAEGFFPTLIYAKDVDLNTDQLANDIVAWSRQDKGLTKTNVKGWHSETNMHEMPQFKSLVDELFKMQFEVFKEENNYDLEKMIDNKSLSSGQMQKIAFIRALVSNVEILLLDESTANLDDKTRNHIFDILSKSDLTIINSTHDPDNFKDIDNHYKIELINERREIVLK